MTAHYDDIDNGGAEPPFLTPFDIIMLIIAIVISTIISNL